VTDTNDKSLRQHRSKQLYERAFFFKRLAIGAADPHFAAKLQPLVDEYESEAARAMLEIEEPAAPQETAARRVMREHRTG
jgi:Tfp pilus assembly protein FimV